MTLKNKDRLCVVDVLLEEKLKEEQNNDNKTLELNDENEHNDDELKEVDSNNDTIMKSILETLLYVIISCLVILAFRTFVVQHVKVSGTSMHPTLLDGEHLLIEKISYKLSEINRFDIVVFKPFNNDTSEFYVKRVIGLPGETVYIEDNVIYIDGEPLDENYGGNEVTEPKDMEQSILLGEDEYFVLGDNRGVSKDSRDSSVGAIDKDSIIGKAWYVIYPVYKVGFIEHE